MLSKAKMGIDKPLLYASLALACFGVVMVYSTSSFLAAERFGSSFHFVTRQLVWLVATLVLGAFIIRMDLKRFSEYSPAMLIGVIIALCLVFLMPSRNDAQRWIFLGPFTMQPSEFAKIVLTLFMATALSNTARDMSDYRQAFLPFLPTVGVTLLLIILEPDLGTAIVIGLTVLSLLFMAGARALHLFMGLAPLAGAAVILVFGLGYKIARIKTYLASLTDPLQGSYQVKQAILTLGSGGIAGSGLGDGRQKLFFLPYPHTDFIFAAIGEEVGFLGLLGVIVLFCIVLYRGLLIASQQPDRFGFLLASGLTLSLFFNVAINMAVVTSLIPTTGLPLPFLSYGGSSLLINGLGIALLLNLSRRRDGWTR